MHTCVRKALQIAVTAGGLMFLGAGIASADSTDVTGDLTAAVQADLGVDLDLDLGQLPQAVDVPITISDNEINILTSPAADENNSDAAPTAGESDAVIDVPITVTDNTVTVFGDADTGPTDGSGSGTSNTDSTNTDSAPTDALIEAPITITDNTVTILDTDRESDAVDAPADPASPEPAPDANRQRPSSTCR